MKAIAAILALATLCLGITGTAGTAAARSANRTRPLPSRPNIVFILTDDQSSMEMDGNRVMQTVDSVLVSNGMTLTNYFTTIGLCCPSRVTTMRGLYGHGTHVYSNVGPWGGYDAFHRYGNDRSNIATWLHKAGYETAMIGKFLNGYDSPDASVVPPGWDTWFALTKDTYVNFYASVDGVETHFPLPIYQTDELRERAISFIAGADPTKPLFLYWAPHAPHDPATPAKEDRRNRMCEGLTPFRPESYDEPDVSDKPPSMQKPLMGEKEMERTDQFRINQCKSLQAVDRSVGDIVTALEQAGRQNTLFIYASDNGMLYGEHRITMHKNNGYDEAIHVPFIARWDGVIPPGTTDDHLAVNIDLASTFAEAAGVTPPYQTDGTSLLPILRGSHAGDWRHAFLIEHTWDDRAYTFCGVRTDAGFSYGGVTLDRPFKYVWYLRSGEQELYDLSVDPLELNNQALNPDFWVELASLHGWADEYCVPRPPDSSPISTGDE